MPDVSWEDVGGLPEVKQALQDLIQLPLRHEALVAKFGMAPSRGALLYGPPGGHSWAFPARVTPADLYRAPTQCDCRLSFLY